MAFKGKIARFKKGRKGFKRSFKGKSRAKSSSSFNARVRRAVVRTAEKKVQVFQRSVNIGGMNNTGFAANQSFAVGPSGGTGGTAIVQGTAQADRIGNRIRTKKLVMRYVIFPYPYDASFNTTPEPQNVRMWFCRSKVNSTVVAGTPPTDFFQTGNGSTGFSSNLVDMNMPFNTDTWTVFAVRTHKIGLAAWVATPGSVGSEGYFANNDYAFNALGTIDLTKYCAKQIKYNDSSSTSTSPNIQVFIEAVDADGDGMGANEITAFMNYTTTYEFTDL